MKRLRSSDDLDSYGEKGVIKDWGRREEDPGLHRSSSSHRSSYYKSSESGRKGLSSSSSRYDRLEDERDNSRSVRKWSDYDMDGYDRRKSYDRHREGNERGILSSSPRVGYGMDRIHSSESFSGPRREFPKGFRSESKRSRREGSVSSWRRFSGAKDGDDGNRSSGSELARGNRVELEDVSKVKSPQGRRDAKSPAWSKDSVSDQSKSFEVKRTEDLPVDSGAPSSEREEGELEPDPQPMLFSKQAAGKLNSSQMELHHEHHVQNKVLQQKENSSPLEMGDMGKVGGQEEPAEVRTLEDVQDITNQINELPDGKDSSPLGISESGDENEATGDNSGGNDEEDARGGSHGKEDAETTFAEKPSTVQKEQVEDKGTDLEVKAANTDMPKVNKGFAEESGVPLKEETTQNLKDKGKSIAFSPSNCTNILETGLEVENKSRGLTTFEDTGFEGLSTRGFEFFSNDPVKKHEKVEQSPQNPHKDEKLALDLTLSLPNVLLPIGAQNRSQDPGSPSHGRSAQSFPSTFHTNSDGFTASMSFSGSQQFTHNPSCSLTYDAYDYEKSVGSRPIFQGVDWKALSSDDHKKKEVPIYQGTSIGNSLHHQSQASRGNSSGQPVLQHLRVVEGGSKVPIGLDRQLSVNKHLRGAHSQQLNDIRSPSQSIGSHENRPGYGKDRRPVMKDRDNASLHRISNPEGKEQALVVGADFAESIVTMIVAEPLHTMAQRFNEMTEQHVTCVKEFVREIILNPGKQWQLSALQKALRNRKDIALDMLVKSHVSQLEILVALKTGLQEFLQQNCNVPSSDLAEIFLNLRCRNLTCRSLVPVDECDCKICMQKNGFCRECMCLVCSKFDMASNTCSWVGCDVCLHWCHADCGLRESYIRNGRSASGAQGTTEMQFHCVACDHPSEMFGFVKEVFQNYVKEWTAETLSRELEYVKRIFSGSGDLRGKQLHEIASQMLSKLANRAYLQEVQNHILGFFNESDLFKQGFVPTESRKDLSTKNKEGSNGIAGSSQGPMWLKSVSSDKAPRLEKSLLSSFDGNRDDKYKMNMDLPTEKEPIYDELESIVRIKQAEAKMFQARADDARREAEALKRIAVTKNERIEEEYTTRIAKLRLAEADEMHKQKVEELQGLEGAYQEYFNMKMRMETDIKDLLLKMESTRRNLTM
ncbi:Protein OBERON 4 [Forsythia ovata]|uniref:Protein OBERON 4 n=1 Tax=Forsythia ovata TaxID=205694 RepID=A0ABD1VHA4_9LAMI